MTNNICSRYFSFYTNFLHSSSVFWRHIQLYGLWCLGGPGSCCCSSWVQLWHQHEASSRPLGARRGRCWTGGSGDNSLCPGVSRYVSVRETETCEREPAAAGGSDPSSYCPGSPATKHSGLYTFESSCSKLWVPSQWIPCSLTLSFVFIYITFCVPS